MALTPSQRPNREWLLLVFALVVVAAVCVPLWQWAGRSASEAEFWAKWTPERLSRLLLGPEQIACYCCMVWAAFILVGRYREVWRQRRTFHLDPLPTGEGARILPEDARTLLRKLDKHTALPEPSLLETMSRMT